MKPIASLFAASCLYVAAAACLADEDAGSLVALPNPAAAPEIDLAAPNGQQVRLSDFQGKPLIVNFWATWCPPCRAEMPSLQRAWEQLAKEGIGLVAVNVGEDADTIRQFTATTPVTFPLLMDSHSRLIRAWRVPGLPTTYVVDPTGRLAYMAVGEREWDDPALLDVVRELKEGSK